MTGTEIHRLEGRVYKTWQLTATYTVLPVLTTTGVIPNIQHETSKTPNGRPAIYILMQKAAILTDMMHGLKLLSRTDNETCLVSEDRSVLHCTALCCTVLYCTVRYCNVLNCTVGIVLYCNIMYSTVLYYTIIYCIIVYCTVLYCTVLYHTVMYCTVL